MTAQRRNVRATTTFFEDLDAQLGPERGPHGEPSAHDFQVFELLRIVEVFATRFDGERSVRLASYPSDNARGAGRSL